jgi:hypothetical protein
LYLNPAGAAAMREDMKDAAVAGAVESMESAINVLPCSTRFDFSIR